MYKIIDNNLRIASCSISDLTMQQVNNFLANWESDASIGMLTLFYDSQRNLVVLNKDNDQYENYLEIVKNYMLSDDGARAEIMDRVPEPMRETMKVLEYAVKQISYADNRHMVMKNRIDMKCINFLDFLFKNEDAYLSMLLSFNYGVICGKRHERARRKKRQAHK